MRLLGVERCVEIRRKALVPHWSSGPVALVILPNRQDTSESRDAPAPRGGCFERTANLSRKGEGAALVLCYAPMIYAMWLVEQWLKGASFHQQIAGHTIVYLVGVIRMPMDFPRWDDCTERRNIKGCVYLDDTYNSR